MSNPWPMGSRQHREVERINEATAEFKATFTRVIGGEALKVARVLNRLDAWLDRHTPKSVVWLSETRPIMALAHLVNLSARFLLRSWRRL